MKGQKSTSLSLLLAFSVAVGWHMAVPTASFGQAAAKGSITGTVTDSTGGVVPGAEVTAVRVGTNIKRTTTTDVSGNYAFLQLEPETYRVEVQAQGFRRAVRPEIQVAVQAAAEVNFALELGELTQTMVVEAREEVLKTTDTSVSGLVTDEHISQLPMVTRNFSDLMRLQPGVIDSEMVNPEFGATGIGGFANGQRIDTNTFTLDGSNLNDPGFPGNAISTTRPVPLEAIKEYRVQLSNPDASFGTSSGAQVAMTTKSGTNKFHGSVFYLMRNSVFNARQFFDTTGKVNPLKTHQYGFSLGGPVIKDRTFFFGTFEGFRERRGLTIGGNVPSAALYNFIPDGAANGFLRSVLQAAFRVLPDVTPAGLCQPPFTGADAAGCSGRATFSPGSQPTADTYLIRVDHQFTAKDLFYARYYWTHNLSQSRYVFSPSGTSDFTSSKNNQNILISYERVFSSTKVNAFRASWYRPVTRFPADGSRPELNQFGINGDQLDAADSLPFMIFAGTGMSVLGQFSIIPFARPQHNIQINDDFSLTWGKHQIKIGGERFRTAQNELISNNIRGTMVFVGFGGPVSVTSARYASLEQNLAVSPDHFQRGYRATNWSAYITDVHRVTSKLTLNYGLRWEYFGVPTEVNGFLQNLYERDANGNPIEDHSIRDFNNIVIAQAGDCSGCLNWFKGTFTNFQPRIGIAYKVFPKTVVRAGFALLFNPWYYEQFNPVRFNAPETVSATLTGQLFGTKPTLTAARPQQNAYGVDPGLSPSYTQSWSLFVQQEITTDSTWTIGYVGNRAVHLTQLLTPNLGANVAQAVRPNQGFAVVDYLTNSAFSTYHGLQTEFLHRFSKGLLFQVNYTWAKSLDNGSISHTVFNRDRVVPVFSSNPAENYGPSDYDIRHQLRGNWFYELPFGRGRKWAGPDNGFVRHVISDWSVSGIFVFQSGHPFNILSGIDSNLDGNINDRAVILTGTISQLLNNGTGGKVQYLSPKLASCPAGSPAGAVCTESGVVLSGNYALGPPSGRNVLEGPSMTNFDLVLHKNFKLTEALSMEFRTEFYNAFNITSLQPPDPGPNQITQSTATFGKILLQRKSPRELQFALRFQF